MSALDLDRARETIRVLDRLHDRPRGGVRDRRSRRRWSSSTASRTSTPPASEDEVLAESAAGELIASEIEIRSGRARDLRRGGRAPSSERRDRLFGAGRADGPGAGRDRHPPLGELPRPADHRHAALQPAQRGTRLGRAAQQHLEPARPHGRARRRPRDRRLRLAARAAAAAARRLRQLALPRPPRQRPAHGAHRDLHPHLPALRRAQPVRRLGHLRGLRRACSSGPGRWSSRPSSGGACARTTPSARSRCGSATRRPAARSRPRSPA